MRDWGYVMMMMMMMMMENEEGLQRLTLSWH